MYWAKFFLAISLLMASAFSGAVESIKIELDSAWLTDDTGIRGEGIQLSLGLENDGLLLLGEARVLQLPAPYGQMKKVHLRCPQFVLIQEKFSCQRGTLQFVHTEFGQQKLQFSLTGNSKEADYHVAIQDMALAEGRLKLTAEVKDKQWSAKITSQQLAVPVVFALASQQENNVILLPLTTWLSDATVNLEVALSGQDALEQLKFSAEWFALGAAAGTATITGGWQAADGTWLADVTSQNLGISDLLGLVTSYTDNATLLIAKSWLSSGQGNVGLQLKGKNNQLDSARLISDWNNVSGSDEAGEYVSEAVSAVVTGEWQQGTYDWLFNAEINSGQAYVAPIFLDFEAQEIALNGQGQWEPKGQKLHISDAAISQAGVTRAGFSAAVNVADWMQSDISVQFTKTDVAMLYEIWLQPFLLSNAAGKMTLSGEAELSLNKQADDYQLALVLDTISVKDEAGRFQLDAVSGELGWTSLSQPIQSTLRWQGGLLYAIPFGASSFQMESVGAQLRLTQPSVLPILDGALTISEFALERPLDDSTKWSFAAVLSPVSMPLLSGSLGWPSLSGQLSGQIPQVAYQYKKITMDGDLSVNLFDGQAIVQDLELDDPFGALPQLSANIDMTEIDLSLLTETFDFGGITGKLDGYIHDLRLSNWQAVAFDAAFATPEGDKHRRRISQKAVEQLTEVGGGPSAALSKSFLRFFEDFSYQKMGLSCKLRNNVCDMAGVGDASPGYYIVKGGGLPPRINIVGYTKRVDWSDLLARLKAVSESDGPIIK